MRLVGQQRRFEADASALDSGFVAQLRRFSPSLCEQCVPAIGMRRCKIEAGLVQPDPNRVLPCRVVARAKKVCFALDRLLAAARFLKDSRKHVRRAARTLAAQRSSGSDMLQRTWRVAVD